MIVGRAKDVEGIHVGEKRISSKSVNFTGKRRLAGLCDALI